MARSKPKQPFPYRGRTQTTARVAAWVMPERCGETTRDYGRYGHHGTIVGPTWTDSPYGPALEFDGSDDYVSADPDSSLDGKYLTVTAVLNHALAGTGWPRIVDRVYNGQFAWYVREASLTLGFAVAGESGSFDDAYVSSSNAVVSGQWHHYAVSYDGDYARAYRDGVEYGAKTHAVGPLATSTSELRIGQRSDAGSSRALKGGVACVKIWGRALSVDQIRADYADTFAAFRPRRRQWGRKRAVFPGVGGPYRVALGELCHSGGVAGQTFHTGAAAGQTFHTGQTAGEIDGRCG